MNPVLRAFFDALLIENPVFMIFTGALLAAAGPWGTKSSFLPAGKFSAVLTVSAAVGSVCAAWLGPAAAPAVYLAVSAAGVALLRKWGELDGEWLGLPKAFLAFAPLAGVQMTVSAFPDFSSITASSVGNGLGFAWAYIVIGSIREFSRISEAPGIFKTYPVIFFSMAVFALLLTGFVFY